MGENINEKHLLKLKEGESLDAETILKFADDFFDKKLESFKVSAPIVDDKDILVKVFVMDNFRERVYLAEGVHTLMTFTTKTDSGVNETMKVLEEVAMKFKDQTNLQIGIMDFIENDWVHMSVK